MVFFFCTSGWMLISGSGGGSGRVSRAITKCIGVS